MQGIMVYTLGLAALGLLGSRCGGIFDPPDPPPPFRRLTEVVLIQDGVAETLKTVNSGIGYPRVAPGRPFDLIFVTDGDAGVISVEVGTNGATGYLTFQVNAGCAKRYGARVSPLSAGWYWSISIRYDNVPERPGASLNPCPQIAAYAHDYVDSWNVDLSHLPRIGTEPSAVTVSRISTP